jgi:hypothetical protein
VAKPKQARAVKVIDPELTRTLDRASAGSTVQAVFTLRTPAGSAVRSSASTQAVVDDVIAKATKATKTPPKRVTVFPNVQSFAVAGSPELVRAVMAHDDVGSAMANVQKEDLLIRPVKKPLIQHDKASARKRNASG